MSAPEVVFETPRLRARRLRDADAEALLSVYGDPQVVRWVDDGEPLDRAGSEAWIEVTRRNYAIRGYGMLALVESGTGAVIGFCGLVHPGGQAEAEIKYALRRDCWGRGFATEAARALLAYGHAEFGLTEVIATTAPENTASHHVLEKVGMRRGALRREDDGSSTQVFVWRAPPAAPPAETTRPLRPEDIDRAAGASSAAGAEAAPASLAAVTRALKRALVGGRLRRIPRNPEQRDILLALLCAGLRRRFPYSEREINRRLRAALAGMHADVDHVTCRRYLVDLGFLRRDRAGVRYFLDPARVAATLPAEALEQAADLIERALKRRTRHEDA